MKQVFISYSSQDRAVAEGIHDALEKAGIPAWLAHRDLTGGVPWSQRIIDEIQASPVMILILSQHANASQYVIREVGEAVDRNATILTVRIEDVAPSKGLRFFIGAEQWLDAFDKPISHYMKRLIDDIRLLLPATVEIKAVPAPQDRRDAVAPPPLPPMRRPFAWARNRHTPLIASIVVLAVIALGALGIKSWLQADVVINEQPGDQYVGDSLRLSLQTEHETVTWSSSNPEVMIISPGSVWFRAVRPGTATLRAHAGRKSDSVLVKVTLPPLARLTIVPPPAIRVGESHSMQATAVDVTGRSISSPNVQWQSETPRIVTIDNSTGIAEGVTVGRGRIKASADTVNAAVVIVVNARRILSSDPSRARVTPPVVPPDSSRPATPVDSSRNRATQPLDPPRPATPSVTVLNGLARLCADNLVARNLTWINANYRPATTTDNNNLNRLRTVIVANNSRVTLQGENIPRPEMNAIDFSAVINYRTFSGGNAGVRGTFRVLATQQSGTWRLASCRVEGALLGT